MTLIDITEFIIDTKHKTPKFVDEGFPCIRTPNIGRGFFILDNAKYVSEASYNEWISRAKPSDNDLILAREAPVGNVAIVPKGLKVCHGQRTVLIRPNKAIVYPRYLMFLLLSDDMQNLMHSLASGATVAHLNMSDIRNLKLPEIPDLPTQQKIASILSAYDDLVENNTRRIKILEEMAQTIYREWFVNFRFPSHEKIKFVDSPLGKIPDGWKVKKFEDVATYLIDGDWIETKDQGGSDYRLLQISNIGINQFVETENFRFITQDTFERLNCTEMKEGDILIARMPTPIGRGWLVTKQDWKMITAVDVAILRPNEQVINKYFLIHFINSPYNLERSLNHSTGTTRPRLTRRDLAKFDFISPTKIIQNNFGEICENISNQVNNLTVKNQNLRKTRDLLLPKLMSGEVEV